MTKHGFVILLSVLLLVPAACYDPEPPPDGVIQCGENGMCPEGMTCDPRDNHCWREPPPGCLTDDDCEGGACDQATGMCVESCRPETCVAGPCQTARCDGDQCVVEEMCGDGEMCCGNQCVAAGCDDGDPCTDDQCGDSGCEHAPNSGATCDDGVHCNGADTCVDGACTMHGGDPCVAPTVCDESADMCAGCLEDSHCPAVETGAWSECGGFVDACDQSGTRSRTVTTYTCQDKMCVPTTITETEDCARVTEDVVCGAVMYGQWGSCGGFADACDQSGVQSRDVTTYVCASEVCAPRTAPETQACGRVTEGSACGADEYGAWSACAGYDNTCDAGGTRSRDVTTYTCASDACVAAVMTESEACGRETDGFTCGPDEYEAWGACAGFSGVCDESGTHERVVTTYACSGESCAGTPGTDIEVCYRDTDGISCGTTSCAGWGTCSGFVDMCDETGTQSRTCTDPTCANGTCEGVARTEIQDCVRDTDNQACGEVTCGPWSGCSGFADICDEGGVKTRTCTAPICSNGACLTATYTETAPCSRVTEGAVCGATMYGSWGTCSGFSDTCDQSGVQARSVTNYSCQSQVCTPSTTSETQACGRVTEGDMCAATTYGSWGACAGYDDTCDAGGTRSRSVTTYTCASDACVARVGSEGEACGRATDGVTCSADEYGSWSACGGYSGVCDESGTRERSVTMYECSGESCAGTIGTAVEACYRDTDGDSCGATSCNGWGTCGGFADVCDETGTQSRTCTDPTCTSGTCGGVARTETQSCVRDTDGVSCGTTTCGAWSGCNYSDTCDENATKSRTCTSYSCATAGCVATTYTETASCARDTDGTTCAAAWCDAWGTCGGFDTTCDESGTQSRTCTAARACSNGVCPAGSTTTETQSCLRNTDGDACVAAGKPGICDTGICYPELCVGALPCP